MTAQLPENYSIHIYDELESTNDLIKKMDFPDGSIVFAKSQRNGKGKGESHWLSPLGNLAFSLVLDYYVRENLYKISQLVFLMAISIREALAIEQIKYKWPNDIMLEGKKLGGILVETVVNKNIIIGVGININAAPLETSTSLDHHRIEETPINLLKKIIVAFDKNKKTWLEKEGSFGFIKSEWKEHAFKINENIVFEHDGGKTSGTLIGINDNGAILIQIDGEIKSFYSGNICIT